MTASEVYLKTRQVALALGVSVSTIKRWVDLGIMRASRTVGKHRLILLTEVMRFARENELPLANLKLLGGVEETDFDTTTDIVRSQLLAALREGKSREARRLIHAFHAAGHGGVELADQLIRPVMARIGRGWSVGALDVFQEHEATQTVAISLLELIERVTPAQSRTSSPPLALGSTSEDDPYVLPGLLGEFVLREQGWDSRNLGVNLPLTSLANAVREYQPQLVFLSVSHLADEERFVREYPSFYSTAVACGAAVILGGQALGSEIRARLVYTSFGDRMAHLAEFARRLFPASGERVD
jgi:MerR family transcriptional regulator, light-induced transcriptional regulator